MRNFTTTLFFHYIVATTDSHAKNFSVFIDRAESLHAPKSTMPAIEIAPLYDVASQFPYATEYHPLRMALSIGGERRIGFVDKDAIERFVFENDLATVDLDLRECMAIMRTLAASVPQAMDKVLYEYAHATGARFLRRHMFEPIKAHCNKILQLL